MVPNTIGQHPWSKRILLTGQPLRQFQPAALLRVDLRSVWNVEYREKAARDDRAEFLRLAANTNFRVADGLGLTDTQRGVASGCGIGQRLQFCLKTFQFLAGIKLFGLPPE